MNLKTSFFNRSVYKSDIKRFWWLGALEAVIICLACVVTLYKNCELAIELNYAGPKPEWMGFFVILGIFSIGVVTLLLSYMHFTASLSMHHAIPVKRTTLLTTKIISALTLTIIPIIINAFIIAAMLSNPNYRDFYSIVDVMKWLWAGILYTLVFLSLTSLVNMMTGNPIGTLIFTLGFIFLPIVIYSFAEMFCEYELFGYASPQNDFLAYLYINQENLGKLGYSLIYLAMTMLFTVFAYVLYKKRKLESYGEVIAFGWLKPVFIGIVAALSSMLSYAYFVGILGITNEFTVIPLGIMGTLIAVMTSRKKLSLNGSLRPLLVYSAVALIFCGAVKFDVFGYEKRIPNPENIENVTILNNPEGDRGLLISEKFIKYKGRSGNEGYFTEKTDIENVIKLHKHMIETKGSNMVRDNTFPIEYTLKNGHKIRRRYGVDMVTDADFLRPLYETDILKEYNFPVINTENKNFYKIIISDRRVGDVSLYPDSKYMQKLIDAFEKDVRLTTYDEYVLNDGASTMIDFYYEREFDIDSDELEKLIENFGVMTQTNRGYYIRSSFKNTIAVLTEMGYYNDMPTAEDIQSAQITVQSSQRKYNDGKYETYSEDAEEKGENTVTNPQEIAEFYKLFDNMIEVKKYQSDKINIDVYITYTLKSGKEFAVSCTYDEDKLPEIFKKYIK